MNLQYAIVIKLHEDTSLMYSALPNAPTLPEQQRSRRAARIRETFAGALHRLGDAVAPAPLSCDVAVCAGNPAH